ncbi:MAG: hypothetical protein JWQ07_4066 [Ramlibacter sp.]|nr:hypothetical protein [Ramlibacter sp.]
MNEILSIALRGMQSDAARVEQIANNLANVLTPGYKRGVTLQAPAAASFASHIEGGVPATVAAPAMELVSDVRAATLKSTGQSLDLALAGRGYFEVMTDNGPAYTRKADLHVDARGRLVNAQGFPVMGVSGEITLNFTHPLISTTGAITSPTAAPDAPPLAQLKVVQFDDEARLEHIGDGLVAAGTGMKQMSDKDIQVRQGFLENSNVDSAREMTGLIQAMRHFESMQKMAQGYDDMVGVAIRKLGDIS